MIKVYRVVLNNLNQFDPNGLLRHGAPEDEYTGEARSIAANISRADSTLTIARIISDVFHYAFGYYRPAMDYYGMAKAIKRDLEASDVKTSKYYCTSCDAALDHQDGFDPDSGSWVCKSCGQQLVGENNVSDVFGDVVWYCDHCGAILNRQQGFTEMFQAWHCAACGHENRLTEADISDVDHFS